MIRHDELRFDHFAAHRNLDAWSHLHLMAPYIDRFRLFEFRPSGSWLVLFATPLECSTKCPQTSGNRRIRAYVFAHT
jgi:hypothetical protein